MMLRADPFEILEPYAVRLLAGAANGCDLTAIALPRYKRLARALTGLLNKTEEDRGGIVSMRAQLLHDEPELAPHVDLLEHCAAGLTGILTGRVLATDVLFPAGNMALVEPIYRGNRWSDHFNRLTAALAVRAVEALRAQKPAATVRLLEAGAGTGGTSCAVLAALEPHKAYVSYDYTDISPGFVQFGKRVHGAGRAFFAGLLLDLERPPLEQGFDPGAYDVVIATNVLHATRQIAVSLAHINALLAHGGLLLLNELTRTGAFATMTFGLLDGWWAFDDAEVRLPDAPLLSPKNWRGALAAAGFNAPAILSWTDPPETAFQCLFVAAKQQKPASDDTSASSLPVANELIATLARHLARLLGLQPHELAPDRPLNEFGVDSIIAPQLVAIINQEMGSNLAPSDVFNHATLAGLAARVSAANLALRPAARDNEPVSARSLTAAGSAQCNEIAVIGLSCRFPGAADAGAFWDNIVGGKCTVSEVPSGRWDRGAGGKIRWGGFLEDHDCFDPEFFNLSWREAEAMSPQQRVFLEQAWNALENAGYGKRALAGYRCGVFVGAAPDGYGVNQSDSLSSLGGSLAILAARISYLLDLKGPSLPIDTACSSSLVAVHMASQSLLAGDCDMALAGGVSILMTDTRLHDFLEDAGMLSPTGQCHVFDAAADGFVPGEGAGVAVLKRLSRAIDDGDAIIGVIKASGINQDGRTSGITAPSGAAQAALEREVLAKAGLDPKSIGLAEAHGTGTRLGDPIEVKALTAAFGDMGGETGFCALGSVKTNIGHTLTAAGIASLIKALLALQNQTIPPSLNFSAANPEIDFAGTPFHVPREAMAWTRAPRHAVISSFGFSGTNAHAVIAEAPPVFQRRQDPPSSGAERPAVILLSARTNQALDARRLDLLAWLQTHTPPLEDLAFTLSQGRGHFEYRAVTIASDIEAVKAWLKAPFEVEPLRLPVLGEDAEMAALLAKPAPDLAKIADCYSRGGDGDWARIAAPGARRLALPGYPFERRRFAVRPLPKPYTFSEAAALDRLHPMLQSRTADEDSFSFQLALDPNAPWLRDHRFEGRAIVPAMGIVEFARAATTCARGLPVTRLSDLKFTAPSFAGPGCQAELTLRGRDGGFEFKMSGRGGVHASGHATFAGLPLAPSFDAGALAARLHQTFNHEEIYERFKQLGFSYGPAFCVISSLRAGPDDVLAELISAQAPDPAILLDPALLDGALQAAIGLMLIGGEAFTSVVPVAIGDIAIYGAVTTACVAHIKRRMCDRTEARLLDISVFDRQGRALVILRDVLLRVSVASSHQDQIMAFSPVWEKAPLPNLSQPFSPILVFDRSEALWRSLGDDAILVRPGSAFCRLEKRSFVIDPERPECYGQLFDLLRGENLLPAAVWHLWSCDRAHEKPRVLTAEGVQGFLREGLYSVFHLAKALARGLTGPLVILHVHNAADTAMHAPVAAFGAALALETPLLQIASIAISHPLAADLSDMLARETAQLRASSRLPNGWAVKLSDSGERLQQRLRSVTLPPSQPLRRRGVFLITGALGGIGRHIALHLAMQYQARLVLTGRSAPSAASDGLITEIKAAGGEAIYLSADISNDAQVFKTVNFARDRFEVIHGIIHAAGVTRDRFLLHKSQEEFAAVLAPKLAGTLSLDRATASDSLDVFIALSSLAGTFGNAGQTDYAAANRFLDEYMAARRGPGRSLSIAWPFWRDGGLKVEKIEQDRRAAATGIRSLETSEGLAIFDALAGAAEGSFLILPGDAAQIETFIGSRSGQAPAAEGLSAVHPKDAKAGSGAGLETAISYLRGLLARATAMPVERIHADKPLDQYGIDSILVTRMNIELERDIAGVPKTLFFEHQTLSSAARFLVARHADSLAALWSPQIETDDSGGSTSAGLDPFNKPLPAVPEDPAADGIAIIGIAGRYPDSATLEMFWDHLCAGDDLITEIPKDRWSVDGWFDPKPGVPGRSYSKWGGFLEGVDQFDPLFFNIAPGDAAKIDPNERLFLEVCWEALENAGHTRTSLSRDSARQIGVYAGVMYGEYQLLAAERTDAGTQVGGASPYWSIANRVSYHFDLHGPSLAIDTACSSSAAAIHLACQALSSGECAAAIAGGVNLSLHPLKYLALSQGRFASSDGRCHSFTEGGDGYVPGEGVGAVILKPLAAARADGDYIHAVIRGWASNHGGKTNGYTVPNPKLQGAVIKAALRRAKTPASSISYIEAHGTGTALGDPVEAAGLALAFGAEAGPGSCALGSLKANIGHLEAAAGIAGLTRVVLQLKHRILTPTLRHGRDNPNIDFAATPFHLQEKKDVWAAAGPLRAGISCFGAGGANVHLVVEESPVPRETQNNTAPALLVLSARTEEQLRAYAGRLGEFLPRSSLSLTDICRTLQIGREPMAARLMLVAHSLEHAALALSSFAAGGASEARFGFVEEENTRPGGASSASLDEFGSAWLAGAAIDWEALPLPGRRVPLPAHPFMRRRFWLDGQIQKAGKAPALHPFIDKARPSLDGAVLEKRFDPADPLVRDHRVQGRLLVPGAAQLEMARAAAAMAGLPALQLTDVVWTAPLEIGVTGGLVTIELQRTNARATFTIRLSDCIVCRGVIGEPGGASAKTPPANIGLLRAGAKQELGAEAIYRKLSALGLLYGPSLQTLTGIWITEDCVLAELSHISPFADVVLPPAILDGALQALLGFAQEGSDERLYVPFALAEARILGDVALARFVIASRRRTKEDVAVFDIVIHAENGEAILRLDGIAARPVAAQAGNAGTVVPGRESMPLTIRQFVWLQQPILPAPLSQSHVLVLHGGSDLGITARLKDEPGAGRVQGRRLDGDMRGLAVEAEAADSIVWIAQAPGNTDGSDIAAAASNLAFDLLHLIRALEQSGRLARALVLHIVTQDFQTVSQQERPDPRAGAVIGLAKSIALEFPQVAVTLSDFDAASLFNSNLPQALLCEQATLPVREIAWRSGVRHVLTPKPLVLSKPAPPLRSGAVVLIAGGAGGIGCAIAGWFARNCMARVVLTGRRPAAEVAAALVAIEAGAGEVSYMQADASDAGAMADVVASLRSTWGGVDAAIHATLVLHDRTLVNMDDETFGAALAPKLAGSVVLAETLAGENLEFFAFLSSVNVISGSRGQANYVAGSSFVDAFARYIAHERPWRVAVTDWGLWGEIGAVAAETYRQRLARQGVYPIRPEEGISSFAAVLAGRVDRAAIVRAEPEALRQLGLDPLVAVQAATDVDSMPDLAQAETAFAALERYGRVFLLQTLQAMAAAPGTKAWTLEGLRRRLGIADTHRRLFPALMDALARDGLVMNADGLWRLGEAQPWLVSKAREALDAATARAPWLAGPARLLQSCLDVYAALLRGETDPVEILFPQASMTNVETAYAGNPVASHFNAAVAETVSAAVAAAKPEPGGIFRIIELGAGTCSTTAAVIEALEWCRGTYEYLVSDLSQRFLDHGRTRFAGRAEMRFMLYDAERNVEENRLAAGGFDIVIAANVLHATSDLVETLARTRRLLRPGGQLILSEAVRAQDFGTLVFGLTPGWWRAVDTGRRIPFSPLVSLEGWHTALKMAGFAANQSINAQSAADSPHALLIAGNSENFAQAPVLSLAQPETLQKRALGKAPARQADEGAAARLQDHLRTILADVLRLDPDEIRLNDSFDRYGLESLTALEIRNRLDKSIPGLPATLLFEHNTLARLAAWLMEERAASISALYPQSEVLRDEHASLFVAKPVTDTPREHPAAEAIAIIGFNGRYPGAPDLEAFWRLLRAGESAIREVPAGRWNSEASFDAPGREGCSYTKWGGFIDQVDRFDPLFFNISPLEAEVMDPQERLFLETAWAVLEQAGYTPKRLRDCAARACPEGSDVGVFVGAMNVAYQWVAAEAAAAGHPAGASTNFWSIANRVSYLFDFSGPSFVTDSACSASLTAIHLACESLRRGECGAAIAGGVNLILHPRQFVNLSQARMVSRGAECRAFGEGADGFVDGEGVGAILLKPLSAAERDGDRIEGVILGSAINSGGRTSGFTVPNPKAQAKVIRAALRRAGAAPDSISFIETHGTGTALGDPIEIAALAEVFSKGASSGIALGTLKANIGHLESAAGIAGLTKILLQLRHRTIPPCRHASNPNPFIDFAATPFALPREAMNWAPSDAAVPLRAGLSSFGAGGANGHLVVESYVSLAEPPAEAPHLDLVVLSAADPEQLRVVAGALLKAMRRDTLPLHDLAHTLRVGRVAMAARVAIIAEDAHDLEAKLIAWLSDTPTTNTWSGVASGAVARQLSETAEGQTLIAHHLEQAALPQLAELWVKGAAIEWLDLPLSSKPRLLDLPTYPFKRERYWLTATAPLHPAEAVSTAEKASPADGLASSKSMLAEEPSRMQLFARTWRPALALKGRAVKPAFVLASDLALAQAFEALWPGAVYRINPGVSTGTATPGDFNLILDPLAAEAHTALFEKIRPIAAEGCSIIQALDWRNAARARESVITSILLTQAAQQSGIDNIQILHLFAEAGDRPLDEALGAFARSAAHENNTVRFCTVGISGAANAAQAAAICRDEFLARDDTQEVLYTRGVRQTPAIEPIETSQQPAQISFRIGGAYLLAGGLGAVGCALAERLGRDYKARIGIIGRGLPKDAALERLNLLRESGVQVHYAACDLTDASGLERALNRMREQLGRLHGVIHLARAVEDGLLVNKSIDSIARVMAAKVEGSAALDVALAHEQLDWFVLCSSLAAWLGLAGGSDYALACAFQNGFARLRQQQVERGERSGLTVAICWPQWQYDNYLNDAKQRQLTAQGLQTIDARDGLRIIAQALQSGRAEVACLKGNSHALLGLPRAYASGPPLADDIITELQGVSDDAIESYVDYLLAPGPGASVSSALKSALDTSKQPQANLLAPAAPAETLEQVVLDTILGFLKLPPDQFSPWSAFADFGLDSIKALHIAERLQKRLGHRVDPAMFYKFPAIADFVRALDAEAFNQPAMVNP